MTTGSLDTFPHVQKSFCRGSPTTNSYSKAQYFRLVAKTHNIRVKTVNKWAKEQFIKTVFSSILLLILILILYCAMFRLLSKNIARHIQNTCRNSTYLQHNIPPPRRGNQFSLIRVFCEAKLNKI